MQISINANRCEPSPMRKFHPYAVQAEKEGKHIYHLNIGQHGPGFNKGLKAATQDAG